MVTMIPNSFHNAADGQLGPRLIGESGTLRILGLSRNVIDGDLKRMCSPYVITSFYIGAVSTPSPRPSPSPTYTILFVVLVVLRM